MEIPHNYQGEHCVGIYHADCFDGVAAAWVLANRYPGIRLVASDYRDAPPRGLKGKIVFIVDFAYDADTILGLTHQAEHVFLIDHHPLAVEIAEEVAGLDDIGAAEMERRGVDLSRLTLVVDSKRSGAQLTWDFLYPRELSLDDRLARIVCKLNERSMLDVCAIPENGLWHGIPRPRWLDAVGYRDLWKFDRMSDIKEICYGLSTFPLDPLQWKAIMESFSPRMLMSYLTETGKAIDIKVRGDIDRVIQQTQRTIELGGYTVPLINAPKSMISEALDRLNVEHPFAAAYFDDATHRVFSLRGKGKLDLNELAKTYGGGGHFNASGFTVPRSHPLAQY